MSDAEAVERSAPIHEAAGDAPVVAFQEAPAEPRRRASLTANALTVWAAITLAFLAFLALGSVRIHQWRWSFILEAPQEDIETVRLIRIWTYQANRLPDFEISGAITALFYVSLFVFVVGSIIATWLLLARPDDAPAGVERTPGTQTAD